MLDVQGVVFLGSEKANETNKELEEKFGKERVMLYTCDITDQASMKAGFEEAKARYDRVDVVCNCGSSWDEIKWENTIQLSLVGAAIAVTVVRCKNCSVKLVLI